MEGNPGKVNPEVVNQALEKLVRAFALAVKDVEFRKFIKAEVGKKFDGDYEFLYKFAREKRFIDGESFETKLGKGYSKVFKQDINEGISRVKELVELIPKFNIAVPVNFEKWDDENYVPLVAYHPVGVDDKLVKKVKAFDSEGNEYWLDAWKAPDFPVIVLGVNERVDDNGNVRYFSLPNMRESEDDGNGGVGGGGSYVKTYKLKAIYYRCNNADFEGWFGGAPEFYIHVYYWDIMRGFINGPIRTDFYDITSEGTYYVNRPIYDNATIQPNLLVDKIKVEVFEDDGGLLGRDDVVELTWRYPYPNSPSIDWLSGDSIPVFYTQKWYFGGNNNVDLCLMWVYE
jgi:hypothetical protein